MRKVAPVLAFLTMVLMLIAGCSGSQPAAGPSGNPGAPVKPADDKVALAKKDGKVVWYVSSYDLDTAKAVAAAFEKKYGITVDVTRVTSQQVYQRITQEISASTIQADVITLTDEGRAITLSDQGHFMVYTPEGEDQMPKQYRGISKKGDYYTHSVGMVLISYNSDKIKKDQAPKSWKELTDPKWKGKISIGHPGASGYVGTWMVQMQVTYGWDYYTQLEANKPLIGQSINDTIPKVISGERLIGVSGDNLAMVEKKKGSPIDVIVPEEGAILMTTPSAIMAKAPHPNAAKLFQDFQFSKEVSEIYVKRGFPPIRPDVPGDKDAPSMDKVLRPAGDVSQKLIPDVIKKFQAVFGV